MSIDELRAVRLSRAAEEKPRLDRCQCARDRSDAGIRAVIVELGEIGLDEEMGTSRKMSFAPPRIRQLSGLTAATSSSNRERSCAVVFPSMPLL